MGAEDSELRHDMGCMSWQECGTRKDVYLTDIEIAANSLINLCFISNYPKEFEESHPATRRTITNLHILLG